MCLYSISMNRRKGRRSKEVQRNTWNTRCRQTWPSTRATANIRIKVWPTRLQSNTSALPHSSAILLDDFAPSPWVPAIILYDFALSP